VSARQDDAKRLASMRSQILRIEAAERDSAVVVELAFETGHKQFVAGAVGRGVPDVCPEEVLEEHFGGVVGAELLVDVQVGAVGDAVD